MKKAFSSLLVALLLLVSLAGGQVKIGGVAKVGGVVKVAVGVASDFVTDTFTETSDTNLQAHTGEVGATWALNTAYSGTALVNASLDRVYLNTTSSAAYYASGTPPSADYCAQTDFRRLTSISQNVGITIGQSTGADTMLLLRLNDDGASTQIWELIERVAGSPTTLASTTSHIPTVGGSAITAKLCRTGTSVTAFFDGVQDTALNSTTTITAAGKAGFRFSGQGSATTGIHVDNFSAR